MSLTFTVRAWALNSRESAKSQNVYCNRLVEFPQFAEEIQMFDKTDWQISPD